MFDTSHSRDSGGAPIEMLDRRLGALGRGLGAMRLAMGEGLVRLERAGGVRLLGFPTLESYARQALERSGRWAADVRALARRLEGLPRLRAALVGGVLTSSKVELLARVASAGDEAEWVERARAMTVRTLRAEVARVRAAEDDDEVRPRVTITTTVDRVDAWAFERARLMVEAVGAARGDEAIDALLAEGLTEIIARHPGIDLPSSLVADFEGEARAWRAQQAALRAAEEAAAEVAWEAEGALVSGDRTRCGATQAQGREGGGETAPEPCAEWLEAIWEWIGAPWPDDVRAIDARLRALARELAWRDLELGALCLEVEGRQLWRGWGHASMDHYCRERIGMAPATVASRVALGRRIRRLPELADAVAEGCVGYEAATLIARVAGPSTVRAWIDRAEILTVKLLREEVQAVELVARADGLIVERVGPPDAELLEGVRAIERAVIATVTGVGVGGPMSGGDDESPMSGGNDDPPLSRTTLRLRVSEDTARFWRGLEALHDEVGEGRSFIGFLVSAATRSWSSSMPARVAYGDVYVRDRWRCASPVCNCRNTTPHHVKFRSHGGGEERSNLISLCVDCHISLVHEGLLSVAGEAPDALVWEALGWRA